MAGLVPLGGFQREDYLAVFAEIVLGCDGDNGGVLPCGHVEFLRREDVFVARHGVSSDREGYGQCLCRRLRQAYFHFQRLVFRQNVVGSRERDGLEVVVIVGAAV